MARYIIRATLNEYGPVTIKCHDGHTYFLYACPKGDWTDISFEEWERMNLSDFISTMMHINREVKDLLRVHKSY
jgi:hypothetical protein